MPPPGAPGGPPPLPVSAAEKFAAFLHGWVRRFQPPGHPGAAPGMPQRPCDVVVVSNDDVTVRAAAALGVVALRALGLPAAAPPSAHRGQ